MIKSKKIKHLDIIYLALLSLYFILSITAYSPLGDRLFGFANHRQTFTVINWSVFAALVPIYILKEHESKKEIILEMLVLLLFCVVTYTNQTVSSVFHLTQWTFFFTTGMFIVCATVTTFKRIAAVTLATNLFMFAVFNMSYLTGFMSELTYDRFGATAHCMGYYYYSHPSYYMLFAWILYMYIRGEKQIGWIELIVEFAAQYWLYKHTSGRLGFVCACMVFVLYVVFIKLNLIDLRWKIVRFASVVGFGAAAVFTLLCGYFFSYENAILSKLNSAINGRVLLVSAAFDRYDINLFGRLITPYENGGYFYLDSCYAYSLFGCGLVFFLVVLAMHSYIYYYSCKTNDRPLFIYMTALMIFGLVGDAWVGMTYSPVFLAFFIILREHKSVMGSPKQISSNIT